MFLHSGHIQPLHPLMHNCIYRPLSACICLFFIKQRIKNIHKVSGIAISLQDFLSSSASQNLSSSSKSVCKRTFHFSVPVVLPTLTVKTELITSSILNLFRMVPFGAVNGRGTKWPLP